MFSTAHLFLRLEFFSAKLMLKTLHIVKEKFVLDKRKVYGHSFIIGLSANYTEESFPSY